jgi:hypothetical protein
MATLSPEPPNHAPERPRVATFRLGISATGAMVEKTSYDLTAPASGILRILVGQDVPFRRGAEVARIE